MGDIPRSTERVSTAGIVRQWERYLVPQNVYLITYDSITLVETPEFLYVAFVIIIVDLNLWPSEPRN